MLSNKIFFPKDENKKLAQKIPYGINVITDATLELAKESSSYLKPWEMTEVLQDLENEGIFKNI